MAISEALQNNLNLENFDTLDEDLLDEIFEEYINKAFEKVCDFIFYVNLKTRFFEHQKLCVVHKYT
jgi:hypothetical protein